MSAMQVICGCTEAKAHLRIIRENGWGRMWIDRKPRPFVGEPWGFDNGAFVCWRNKRPWIEEDYLRRLERARQTGTPYLAVIPDIVAAGAASLDFSARWLDRLPKDWPWYLAVQDGMTVDDVRPMLPRVAGLFLGGTDGFKATAHDWSDLAHAAGKRFHYARAGTMRKLWLARLSNADSIDSCFPIWKRERMEQFVRWWGATKTQLLLPWD